jgi:preprotein translocase subunit YajC
MDISLLFPILILLLFIPIFLSSRKQKRAQQEMQALQSSLEPGDIVSTTSGLRATVVDASYEDTVDLEIADGVVTTWVRAAVREKITAAEPVHEDEPPAVVDEPGAPSLEKAPVESVEQPSLVKDVEKDRETDREKDDSTNGSPRS